MTRSRRFTDVDDETRLVAVVEYYQALKHDWQTRQTRLHTTITFHCTVIVFSQAKRVVLYHKRSTGSQQLKSLIYNTIRYDTIRYDDVFNVQ